MKDIVIFASGSGSNAQAIIRHFYDSDLARVVLVLSNKPEARVLKRATDLKVPAMSFNRYAFAKAGSTHHLLNTIKPDLVVLAGFLWKIPEYLIEEYPSKIINIHPALLPKYGGEGMYGMNVHNAVIANKEEQSGITVHYVNEAYDEGAIIAQFPCSLDVGDTAVDLAGKIHELEQQHFPRVIERLLRDGK
ncbi:MAG: phosphoribosylglycinamide formyltransferase [Nonlabens sp.]